MDAAFPPTTHTLRFGEYVVSIWLKKAIKNPCNVTTGVHNPMWSGQPSSADVQLGHFVAFIGIVE